MKSISIFIPLLEVIKENVAWLFFLSKTTKEGGGGGEVSVDFRESTDNIYF